MTRSLSLVSVVLVAAAAFPALADVGDHTGIPQASATPPSGRYEIVRSSLFARLTFKLDKFTGRVWELVERKDEQLAWEPMEVASPSQVPQTSTVPRFQISLSGILARDSFLLDSLSGTVWIYTVATDPQTGENGRRFWTPMPQLPGYIGEK